MEKQDGKVYEVLPNGNKNLVLVQNISINGGSNFEPITPNTTVVIKHSTLLVGENDVPLGAGYQGSKIKLTHSVRKMIEMSGGTWEQYTESLVNELVPDLVEEPTVEIV